MRGRRPASAASPGRLVTVSAPVIALCPARTAAAIAFAMLSLPLSLAAAAGSSRRAVTPGYRSAMVDIRTEVSPREGSTWPT